MRDHPRPLLLVDSAGELLMAATRASGSVGAGTVLPLDSMVVRQYLQDCASVRRLPAAAILRVRAQDQSAAALIDWIRGQPAPIGSLPVLMVTDGALAETAGPIDVWLERSLLLLVG